MSRYRLVGMRSVDSHALAVHVYRRSDGKLVASKTFPEQPGKIATPDKPGALLVTGSTIYAESPWDLLTTAGKKIRPQLVMRWRTKGDRIIKFALPPAHHRLGTIALVQKRTWVLENEGKFVQLANVSEQPDLFTSIVPPTVVGDVVYFGNFAVDIVTREILWKLPVKRVSFGAVPADRLVLVVDNGEVLRAYRERSEP